MSEFLALSGYDLTDEGPGRTVNEDATLVREDLGLFAVADGAGGRGRGDVAATLALRTIENYVGSTVRRSHERPDFDLLGTPEQARRLSAAIHRAHANILQVLDKDPDRKGMATTVVAALFSHRTKQIHIAHVGDSRCYRLRHGRLELLTLDHTIANDILERRPETPDEVLEQLPRNSVTCALGMEVDLRVAVRTLDLVAGDRFLLCSDGLTTSVSTATLWNALREPEQASVIVSELLSHALAARSQDNISLIVVDCREQIVDEELETRRYNEKPSIPASVPMVELDNGPNSAELDGPEILAGEYFDAVEAWSGDSELPTAPLPSSRSREPAFSADLIAEDHSIESVTSYAVDDSDLELISEREDEDEDEDESGALDLQAVPSSDMKSPDSA